jgi:heme exporter protein B
VTGFFVIVRHELRLSVRGGIGSLVALIFFVVTVALFPLGVGPELDVLARIATGVVWVAALLAAMLSMERLFQADYEDGTLELLVLSPLPLELVVLAKCLAHWLTTAVPLIIVAPILSLLVNMSPDGLGMLIAAMLLGTPTLSLIGGIGAALTVGARRGGVLLALLVLPLYIPVLIFGVGAVEGAIGGYGSTAPLMILAGLFLGALVLTPFAGAAALRLALE